MMRQNSLSSAYVKTVTLTPPTLRDNTADADRLAAALKNLIHAASVSIAFPLLKQLPELLRKWNYDVRCVLLPFPRPDIEKGGDWLVVGMRHAADPKPFLGLAVDLGTTRVVLRLIDLVSGQALGETSFDNPQISIGPDILARIHYAATDGGLDHLNRLIIGGLNREMADLCKSCKFEPEDVFFITVAGNTAMTHLFMGLNPHWIIREPYIPVVNHPGMCEAKDLGIQASPTAKVLMFPNIGSYFGGDLIAGILFSGMNTAEETAILVDVGTNAEVVLGNKNWLIGCAGAAGPALEGGVTRMGMMAGPGTIDRIAIFTTDSETHHFDIHTIGETKPKGICGSGLIDLAAHLFLSDMIDIRGKFVPSVCGGRLREKDGIPYLVVVPAGDSASHEDLIISQIDLDSLIRSKAAMFTVLETLTDSVGMSLRELTTFYVAGTFGCFINPRSAISIGMIPDLPPEAYKPLGNSSLGGAAMALTSPDALAEIDRIRDRITYLELNVNQEFMNRFSAAKFLPHTNTQLFPSVKVRG